MNKYLIWKRRLQAMTILVCVLGMLSLFLSGLFALRKSAHTTSSLLWIRNVPHTISWKRDAASQEEGKTPPTEAPSGSAAALACYDSLGEALADTKGIAGISGFARFETGEKECIAVLETDREVGVLYRILPAKNQEEQSLLCTLKCNVENGKYSGPVSFSVRGCRPQLSMYRYLWEDAAAEYLCREYLTGSYVSGTNGDIYYGLLPVSMLPALPSSSDVQAEMTVFMADAASDAGESAVLTIDGNRYYFWTLHSLTISSRLASILVKEYTYGDVIAALDMRCSCQ